MKRREFIAALGAATAWPFAVLAQPAAKLPTIGFLGPNASIWSPWTAAFVERLGQLGWIEGRTVAIEYRWAEGRPERVAAAAAEFVRMKVDVVLTTGSAVHAVRQATSTLPIVFAMANDPVGGGLVVSLAKPGGNITGLSTQGTDAAGKRLEILRSVFPDLRRLAVLLDAGYPEAVLELHDVQAATRTLGIEIVPLEIQRAEDISLSLDGLKERADVLYVVVDALVSANRTRITTLALSSHLPTIFPTRDYVQGGALLSYGPNYANMLRRSADLVDKVLRGTNAGDIPVEQPTKFELVINLTTAKTLGLTIPASLMSLADELIE
jgi:putative ABC transport system substrate-binding protein